VCEMFATSDYGRTAVLIVGFCNPEDVNTCLGALAEATPVPCFDIFICENGGEGAFTKLSAMLLGPSGPCSNHATDNQCPPISPSDRLIELRFFKLRQRASAVWVARAAYNLGYAGAVNAMIERLQWVPNWDGIWILNPDTIPYPSALAELKRHAHMAKKGMVGSTIVADGTHDRIQCRAGLRWTRHTGRGVLIDFDQQIGAAVDVETVEAEMDCVSGASMFVRRECVEQIGPMDERFFLYYEDLDWGIRAKPYGLGYAAASIVAHKGGTTIGSSSVHRSDRSWLSIFLQTRNQIHFAGKHFPRWRPVIIALSLVHALRYLISGSPKDCVAALEGLLAGVMGKIGPPAPLAAEYLTRPVSHVKCRAPH
jgi:N-acetylglucosaminyl-diphospho-decaprenol L-rhamnosyltransferase